jgi:hypothetical protein
MNLKLKSKIKNKKGQGLIEALLTIPLMALVMTVLFLLCYRAVVFYYADFHLHEALVCCDELPPMECKRTLSKRIEKVLLGKIKPTWENPSPKQIQINLSKTSSKISGQLMIHFPSLPKNYNMDLNIRKTIEIPVNTKPIRPFYGK